MTYMSHITPYEAAVLSGDSYFTPDHNEPNFNFLEAEKLGWKYVGSSDELGMSKDGYFGVAFKKGDTIAIVHRGNEFDLLSTKSDWDDNILHIACDIHSSLILDSQTERSSASGIFRKEYNDR